MVISLMLKIDLIKMEMTGIRCAGINCKKLPEHMINILGSVYYIKADTTAVRVSLNGREEYYCRGCIDDLYNMMKSKLDPKLWAFH